MNKRQLGQRGEDMALEHIKEAGLNIIQRNYRCPKGEIDIIARDGKTIVFIEVRLRSSNSRGSAEESIGLWKIQRLKSIASYYLLEQHYRQWPQIRFDVFAINMAEGVPEFNWIQGAL
ncbi:Endonuclease [Dehalobacter sp. UNSWDHB]|uniref:YraN family protein n=1 Tax=unclassified Dehalobacter TaxID=2635733 RepID=UPI00028A6C28|nr:MULTISPECIES: YraN family protein [unclassified Dehalobacter]AFV03148.1 hypothetical protein DHBDCA_p2121 [Dehalobacter sp. DCA]AFV06138.1 hypothetical protein DCF50_p2135 [Dehalobacter sp. CF]EQB21164.1 Endonuclease [Dehalobacter sp. UNSWDHB]